MIGAILSLIIMAISMAISAALLMVKGYIKYTAYANALILNGVWFLFGKFGGETFHVWYPNFMDTPAKNFWAVTGILFVVVLVINRFPKIRVNYYISTSVAVGTLISMVVLMLADQQPSMGYAVFLAIFSFVTIILQLGAVDNRGIDDSGNAVSRVFASVVLMPAPFIIGIILMDVIIKPQTLSTEVVAAIAFAVIIGVAYFVFDTAKDNKEERALMASVPRVKLPSMTEEQNYSKKI